MRKNKLNNSKIFSDLNQNDIFQLETIFTSLFMNIDSILGKKSFLSIAGVDEYFITSLDFNLNNREFANILISKFKDYSVSRERRNHHPLMALIDYLIQRSPQYNLDDRAISLFKKIYSIGQENLKKVSAGASPQTNSKLSSYLDSVSQNLIREGCLSPQGNVGYADKQFELVGKIPNFEISFGLLNMRGDAFFIFSYSPIINANGLRKYSDLCFDYAKQEATSSASTQLYNARVPCNICFAIAVVEDLDNEAKNSIRSKNPLDNQIDSLWYLVPAVYSLSEQKLYYYDSPSSFWENFKGEIVWKKLREVIENILTP